MSDFSINSGLIARSYDKNKDGKVSDNLVVRQDPATLKALGGDAEVTVDELAAALAKDKVMIEKGEVRAITKETVLHVPLITEPTDQEHLGMKQASALAAKALEHKPYFSNILFNHQEQALGREHLQTMQTALKQIQTASSHAEIQALASCVNDQPEIPHLRPTDLDHRIMLYRQVLDQIKDISPHIDQPRETLHKAQERIQTAHAALQTQKESEIQFQPRTLARLHHEIQDIRNQEYGFDGRDIESKTSTMNSLREDAVQREQDQSKLEQLAQQSYTAGVDALSGINREKAQALNKKAMDISIDAHQIQHQAEAANKTLIVNFVEVPKEK